MKFPVEEGEDDIPDDAQDMIKLLLIQDPEKRLGSSSRGGATLVKEHYFFSDVNWTTLLRQKAEFIPQLQGEEDTSYFDSMTIVIIIFFRTATKMHATIATKVLHCCFCFYYYCCMQLCCIVDGGLYESFLVRSDRYSHEFHSDEEDIDFESLEQPFENFSSTAPRMSTYLDENFR